jgi:putative endonuclease
MSKLPGLANEDEIATLPAASELGRRGEGLAVRFLQNEGYRIVAANFTAPIGRNNIGAQVKGEIDIVALDGDTLCFVEVKTRSAADFAGPLSNVDLRKQRVVTRTARVYRRLFNIRNVKHRFDVVTVIDPHSAEPEIDLHKSFWTEGKFRKRNWSDEGF